MLPIAIVAVLAIFFTTNRGRRLARLIGLPVGRASRVPAEDRSFLLEACGRDESEVERRLEAERVRYPGFDRPKLYRRAIRTEIRRRQEEDGAQSRS